MPFYNKLNSANPDHRRTAEGLLRLKVQLDKTIPPKDLDAHLLIATWNLREFGASKYGLRTLESMYYIAEVISHFDLVAVQEVRSNLAALDLLMDILGRSMWKYIVTDVTQGRQGNDERLAFIFDTRKLSFGGLAGEIVPEQAKNKAGLLEGKDGFARSPYIAGFQAGWFKFSICTSHMYYGKGEKDPQRVKEMVDLVRLLEKRVESPDRWGRNVIVLGDFNIFSAKDEAMKALKKVFARPDAFETAEPGSNQDRTKPYDQIGFISPTIGNQLKTAKAGVFDVYESVFRKEDEAIYPWRETKARSYKEWRSYQLSDHLPKWVEVGINFGAEYLALKTEPTAQGDTWTAVPAPSTETIPPPHQPPAAIKKAAVNKAKRTAATTSKKKARKRPA